jgi:hypothetical protein
MASRRAGVGTGVDATTLGVRTLVPQFPRDDPFLRFKVSSRSQIVTESSAESTCYFGTTFCLSELVGDEFREYLFQFL